jgi:site-specific DNA recombinase
MSLEIPTPRGSKQWRTSIAGKILRNESYTGKMYVFKYKAVESKGQPKRQYRQTKCRREPRPPEEWVEVPNASPAIIDQATFDAAQEQLKRNSELAKRNQKYHYLLSGYLICGICGLRYVGITNKRGGWRWTRYYRCNGKQKVVSFKPCPSRYLPADEVEELVWEEVKNTLLNPQLILSELERRKEEASHMPSLEQELKTVQRRLASLRKEEQRLIRLYRFGEFDDEMIEREVKRLAVERKSLLERKQLIERRFQEDGSFDDQIGAIEEYCRRAAQNIESFTYEDKRLAIDALQLKVLVKDEGLDIQGIVPVEVASTPSPSLHVPGFVEG